MKRIMLVVVVAVLVMGMAACVNTYLCTGESDKLVCAQINVQPEATATAPATATEEPTVAPTPTSEPTIEPTPTATPDPVYLPTTSHAKVFVRNLVQELGDAVIEWVDAQIDSSLPAN